MTTRASCYGLLAAAVVACAEARSRQADESPVTSPPSVDSGRPLDTAVRPDGAAVTVPVDAIGTESDGAGRDGPQASDLPSSTGEDARVPDAAPVPFDGRPIGGTANLLWLLDGETGAFRDTREVHDGAEVRLCRPPGAGLDVGDAFPRHSGGYSIRAKTARVGSESCTYADATLRKIQSLGFVQDREYWQGWAVHVPAGVTAPAGDWIVAWWHPRPGNSPPIELYLSRALTWRLLLKYGLGPPVSFGTAAVGQWQEFVANFVISHDAAKGRFKLWHRARREDAFALVVNHAGKTANPVASFPYYPMVGLASVPGQGWPDQASERILYFDEVRVGGDDTSFAHVAPGSGVEPR